MKLSSKLLFCLLVLPITAQAGIQYVVGEAGQLHVICLEADTKPAVANGSTLHEIDTGKTYLRTAGSWVEESDPADGAGGGVDTANSPNANEFARFTDADTIEGRTAAEVKVSLDLEIGTDLQAYSANLDEYAAVNPTAAGLTLLDDANAAAQIATLGITATSTELNHVDGVTSAIQTQLDAKLASASYTAADVLSKLLTVDGAGNGVDADLLDGTSSAGFQTADGDLTSIAALTTTAHGRGLLDDADAAASRASIGAIIGTDVQAFAQELLNFINNCVVANAAQPIPDNCVGDGSDAGGSYSFNADGDNNSPQAIDNTNELLIAGGTNGIDTVASATDTVTLNLDLSESAAGGELGGNLDAPTIDDSVAVTGWTLTDPNIAAGSASAGTWINVASGTLLTTAEDGTIEQDADAFYAATDAGNRGTVAVEHWLRAASDQTLTSSTTAQNIFDSPANGRFTLETGTYIFEMELQITGMSGTSGNAQILLVCGGTCADYNWFTQGIDNTTLTTVGADLAAHHLTNATAASFVTAGTGTAMRVFAKGSFEVTGAGTFQPQIDLVTAAAGVVESGSYFMLKRIGATSMTSVGQTD